MADLVARLRSPIHVFERTSSQSLVKAQHLCAEAADALAEQAETIQRLRRELEETHEIIKDDVATQEALRLRGALLIIRDGFIPQGMSPALFSEKVLAEVPAIETEPATPVSPNAQ